MKGTSDSVSLVATSIRTIHLSLVLKRLGTHLSIMGWPKFYVISMIYVHVPMATCHKTTLHQFNLCTLHQFDLYTECSFFKRSHATLCDHMHFDLVTTCTCTYARAHTVHTSWIDIVVLYISSCWSFEKGQYNTVVNTCKYHTWNPALYSRVLCVWGLGGSKGCRFAPILAPKKIENGAIMW